MVKRPESRIVVESLEMIYYVVFIQETKQEKEPTMEHQENLVLNFGVY